MNWPPSRLKKTSSQALENAIVFLKFIAEHEEPSPFRLKTRQNIWKIRKELNSRKERKAQARAEKRKPKHPIHARKIKGLRRGVKFHCMSCDMDLDEQDAFMPHKDGKKICLVCMLTYNFLAKFSPEYPVTDGLLNLKNRKMPSFIRKMKLAVFGISMKEDIQGYDKLVDLAHSNEAEFMKMIDYYSSSSYLRKANLSISKQLRKS